MGHHWTEAEYLASERESDLKHEFRVLALADVYEQIRFESPSSDR